MPVILDEQGTIIGVVPGAGRSHVGIADSSQQPIDDTLGGKLWRFFHPSTERKEYNNSGIQPPPPVTAGDIYEQAATDLRTTSAQVYTETKSVGQWIVIGLVAIAMIYVADRMPSKGRVQRKVREYRKRAAHAVSRRIAG